jgi:hypothetical protein
MFKNKVKIDTHMYIPQGEESGTEAERKARAGRVDIFPAMWIEYLDLKSTYRKVEREYYGFLGMKWGKKKKEELSLEDQAKIKHTLEVTHDLSAYCINHKKPILNEQLIHFRWKIDEFLKRFPQKIQDKK